jgi:hypothetical protein
MRRQLYFALAQAASRAARHFWRKAYETPAFSAHKCVPALHAKDGKPLLNMRNSAQQTIQARICQDRMTRGLCLHRQNLESMDRMA